MNFNSSILGPEPLSIPFGERAHYIYVVRNPLDACVSYYHYTCNAPWADFKNGSFDIYFDLFCKGDVWYGNYMEHMRRWLDYVEKENVLLIRYEWPFSILLTEMRAPEPAVMHYLKTEVCGRGFFNACFVYSCVIQDENLPGQRASTRDNKWKCSRPIIPESSFSFASEKDGSKNRFQTIWASAAATEFGWHARKPYKLKCPQC